MINTGLEVVGREMGALREPVGTERFKRDFLLDTANEEQQDIVRAVVVIKDAQEASQIPRLYAVPCLTHLLPPVPLFITHKVFATYDALVEWALASIVADDGVAAAGLPTPEKVANDPNVYRN